MTSRRASIPPTDELFRPTAVPIERLETPPHATPRPARRTPRARSVGAHVPSGRERHDEKITVYCSPEELFELETARLALRADHGLAVDRGRIVREAVALVLADLSAMGEESVLVRRLRDR